MRRNISIRIDERLLREIDERIDEGMRSLFFEDSARSRLKKRRVTQL